MHASEKCCCWVLIFDSQLVVHVTRAQLRAGEFSSAATDLEVALKLAPAGTDVDRLKIVRQEALTRAKAARFRLHLTSRLFFVSMPALISIERLARTSDDQLP